MSQDYKQLLVDAGFDLETKDLVAFSQCLLDNLPPVVSLETLRQELYNEDWSVK